MCGLAEVLGAQDFEDCLTGHAQVTKQKKKQDAPGARVKRFSLTGPIHLSV